MRYLLPVLFPLCITVAAAQRGETPDSHEVVNASGPGDSIQVSTPTDRSFFGAGFDYPVLSWYSRGPRIPLPQLPDSASYTSYVLEQEIGFGLYGLWGYDLTRNRRLRSVLSLGFRRQAGRAYYSGAIVDSGRFRTLTAGRMVFSIHSLRLGGELQYRPIRWETETSFPDDDPSSEERPPASVDRWYALLLRVGATGIWYVGSNADANGVPEPDSIGQVPIRSGLYPEGFNVNYHDGPIPELDPFALELLLGISLDFPVGDQVTGSIGLLVSQNLTPAASDDWSYHTLGVQGGIGW